MVPRLRFQGFNKDWESQKLHGLTLYIKGYAFKSKDFQKKGYNRVIRVSDISSTSIKAESDNVYVSEEIFRTNEKFVLQDNDIIITTVGSNPKLRDSSVGRPVFVLKSNNMILNQNLLVLRALEGYSPSFIYSFLKRERYHYFITSIQRGNANQSNITVSDLMDFSISYPDTEEQQKIASFLSSVDNKISQLEKKKTLLETYKRGIMQKIFSQELRFKDESGQEFPDWSFEKGNTLFSSITNKNHNSDLPILAISQEFGAVPRDMIDYSINVSIKSVSSYKVVEKGNFIISLRSFQGGIEYSRYKGICSPAYIILKANVNIVDGFFKEYFKTHNYIQQLNSKLEGIRDGKMISYKYFSEIELPYPSILEQQKIASFLLSIDKKIEITSTQLEKTREFKKGLLQQMFV